MHGMEECHLIDGSGNDGTAGVPQSGDSSAKIDQMHNVATEHVAEQIRIAGQAEFGVFRLGLANCADFGGRFVGIGLFF